MKLFTVPTAMPVVALACGVLFSPLLTYGQQPTPAPPAPQASEKTKAPATTVSVPVYNPPARGAPGGRVGGGTRAMSPRGNDQTFTLSVLAPNHTGLTVHEQPILYWYLSKPIATPIEFTLTDDGAAPVVEKVLNPPFEAGIQQLRLADFGVHLTPGKQYQWYVALVPDPKRRTKDILAGATIERADLPRQTASKIPEANGVEAARFYAETGHWYDAVASLSEIIEAKPNDTALRSQRAGLLRQVGLSEIAQYDLSHQVGN